MQRISKNRILMGLLLCTLLLTGYISVFNPAGMLPAGVNVSAPVSLSGGSSGSSMNGAASIGHFAYLAAETSMDSFISLLKQSRGLFIKSIFVLLTAVMAARITTFICSSRLAAQTCAPFNAIQITWFLHKKDGMK
jgi:hypothetical protein